MSDSKTIAAENEPVTAIPKPPKMNPNKAAFVELAEAFPQLFNLQSAHPLAIGIHTQLAEAGLLSKTKIRRGLGFYVRQRAYLKAVAAGGPRQGLQGPSGAVTPEEAEYATQQLVELEKVLKERRSKYRNEQHKSTQPKRKPKVPKQPLPAVTNTVKVEVAPPEDPNTRLTHKLAKLSERFGKGQQE